MLLSFAKACFCLSNVYVTLHTRIFVGMASPSYTNYLSPNKSIGSWHDAQVTWHCSSFCSDVPQTSVFCLIRFVRFCFIFSSMSAFLFLISSFFELSITYGISFLFSTCPCINSIKYSPIYYNLASLTHAAFTITTGNFSLKSISSLFYTIHMTNLRDM